MAVPKRRTSRSVSRQRRTHKKISLPNLSACPECSELRPSHQVCPKCGQYAGKQVVEVKE